MSNGIEAEVGVEFGLEAKTAAASEVVDDGDEATAALLFWNRKARKALIFPFILNLKTNLQLQLWFRFLNRPARC